MVGQAGAGLVAARQRIGIVQPQILHMAQHMPLAVLADRLAPMGAKPPEDARGLGGRIPLDRQPAQQEEAAPVQDLVPDTRQPRGKPGQGKGRLVYREDIGLPDPVQRGIKFRNIGRRECTGPVAAPRLRLSTPRLRACDQRKIGACRLNCCVGHPSISFMAAGVSPAG